MVTWLNIWPVMLVPTFVISVISACPTVLFDGRVLGGGPIRQFLLNHVVLPFLPADASTALVQWFSSASVLQEWFLSFCIAVNVNALLLPALYYFCTAAILFSSWFARKNLELKRKAIR